MSHNVPRKPSPPPASRADRASGGDAVWYRREECGCVTGSASRSPRRSRLTRMDHLRSLREITALFVYSWLIAQASALAREVSRVLLPYAYQHGFVVHFLFVRQ